MMTFNLTLTSAQLPDLEAKLSGLITEMDYDPTTGELTIASSDVANEPRIVDIITPFLSTVRDLPDWGELSRAAARGKRLAAAQEKHAMAALRAKRERQEVGRWHYEAMV